MKRQPAKTALFKDHSQRTHFNTIAHKLAEHDDQHM